MTVCHGGLAPTNLRTSTTPSSIRRCVITPSPDEVLVITICETLIAPQHVDDVFDFIADFGRISEWDPNVSSSAREQPLEVGAVANLQVAFGPRPVSMAYTLEELEPGRRVVWRGENTTSIATDYIDVTPAPGGGARVRWEATLAFKGPLGLAERTAKSAFQRLGRTTIEALARALSARHEGAHAPEPPGGVGARAWSGLTGIMDATVAPSFGAPGFLARKKTWADPEVQVDLSGRCFIVTGANSGLGFATTRALLERGASVTMVCRDPERAERALDALGALGDRAALELADMGDLADVRDLGARLAGDAPVHGLIHNAGALLDHRARSPQAHELTFAVHVLGPHVLTRWLRPALATARDARVVFVSSGGMYTQRLDVKQLAAGLRRYDGATVYAQAKRAQVYMGHHWARRLAADGVAVSSMHPGWADTPGLRVALPRFRGVTRALLRTPEQGADTIVWLAASAEGSMARGGFYFDREPRSEHAPLARTRSSPREIDELWSLCERLAEGFLPERSRVR